MPLGRMILKLILFSAISSAHFPAISSTSAAAAARTPAARWAQNDTRLGHSSSLLWSPSPEEYTNLYRVACGLSENGSKAPISREELVEHYANYNNERLKQVAGRYNIERECRREPTAWRFKYIDEEGGVLINERTIDERAADVVYMIRAVKAFSIDIFTYDWDDPAKDRANMDRVVGPNFDDDLCGRQLAQMVQLSDELAEWSQLVRSNATGSASRRLTDQHISLAKSLDSFGSHEAGHLLGRFFYPGSYHQCLYNKLILDETSTVQMRYCWAHLSYERHLSESLRTRRRSPYEHPANVLFAGVCLPESCHSKSFPRHKDAIQQLVHRQFKQPASSYVDENLDLSSLYCMVDDESEFGIPLAGKCLLAAIAGWISLAFGVTIYNSKVGNSARWQSERAACKRLNSRWRRDRISVLESLDLMESWQNFQDYYTRPTEVRAVQLDAMNFFKVFGCAFVVFGHTFALYGAFAMDEVRGARSVETDSVLCIIVAGTLVVDTFFVMSGILWGYFALKRLNSGASKEAAALCSEQGNGQLARQDDSERRPNETESSTFLGLSQKHQFEVVVGGSDSPAVGASQRKKVAGAKAMLKVESWPATIRLFCLRWFSYSIYRYIRIVPTYALVHWFKKYVFIYAGNGPFWDHGFNYKTLSGACVKETPLTPFTFMAAYYPISRQCTLQSWSIANDLFFALIAPPIILLINRRPRVAAWLTLISCLVSYVFALDAIGSYPSSVDEELRELRAVGFYRLFDEASLLYTAPHYRIFCFLTGVWAGYALYHCQAKIDKRRSASTQHRQQQQQQASADGTTTRDQVNADFLTQVEVRTSGEQPNRDRIEWPFWLRVPATSVSVGYMLLIFFCFAMNERFKGATSGYYRLIYPQFITSMRVAWALANSVIFLRMMTDWKDTLLMRWSASKFWQAFSKLGFAILLIHLDLLLYTINVAPTMPTSFTKWSFFNLGAGIFMLCIPLAIFIHVVYEMPFDRLVRSRLPQAP